MLFTKSGQEVRDIESRRTGFVVNKSRGLSFVMWDDPEFDAKGLAPSARQIAEWRKGSLGIVMYEDSLEMEIPNLRLVQSRGVGKVLNPIWHLLYCLFGR